MRRFFLLLILLGLGAAPAQAEPLPANEAFKLVVSHQSDGALRFEWAIADGYYLYRDHINAKDAGGVQVPIQTEPGVQKDDPSFGLLEVYYQQASAKLPSPGTGPIELEYQGCQEDGICYRPEKRFIDPVTLEKALASSASSVQSTIADAAPTPNAGVFRLAEDENLVASLLATGGTIWVVASFLLFGLLLSFTPCVFPMYPILAGALARHGEMLTPRRGFTLSAIYVLSLATAFGLIGAIAGWSGQNLQFVLKSPWMTGTVAAIFIALAFSMFGLFALELPASLRTRIAIVTGDIGGSKRGVAVLGFSSALIVGPCVTAPLAGALLYIGQTADVALGAAALFALGVGKGIPLIIIGTIGGGALPRAGAWMEGVNHAFGFGFVAAAIFIATPLLPARVDLVLWAALLVSIGTYAFSGRHQLSHLLVVTRAAGTMALVYGIILMLGAAAGATDPLKPLATFANAGRPAAAPELSFAEVASVPSLQSELRTTQGARPTLVYFTADWCITCHTIERSVLTDETIRRELDNLHLVKADLTQLNASNTELMSQLRVAGPPTMIFFDRSGGETSGTRLVGEVTTDSLARSVAQTRGL